MLDKETPSLNFLGFTWDADHQHIIHPKFWLPWMARTSTRHPVCNLYYKVLFRKSYGIFIFRGHSRCDLNKKYKQAIIIPSAEDCQLRWGWANAHTTRSLWRCGFSPNVICDTAAELAWHVCRLRDRQLCAGRACILLWVCDICHEGCWDLRVLSMACLFWW